MRSASDCVREMWRVVRVGWQSKYRNIYIYKTGRAPLRPLHTVLARSEAGKLAAMARGACWLGGPTNTTMTTVAQWRAASRKGGSLTGAGHAHSSSLRSRNAPSSPHHRQRNTTTQTTTQRNKTATYALYVCNESNIYLTPVGSPAFSFSVMQLHVALWDMRTYILCLRAMVRVCALQY